MTHPSPVNPLGPEEAPPLQSPTGNQLPPPPQYPPVPPQYPPAPFPLMAQPPGGGGARSKAIGILALVFGAAALLFGLIPLAGIFIGGLFGTAAIVKGFNVEPGSKTSVSARLRIFSRATLLRAFGL